uniref:ABC transporter domain-containing protein n=1 Tax=Hanusia phi TaxID=3032 RepID=A0A6T7S652_9CRYP|eukprot:758480-Hanusia_phi.AAC.2
MTSTNLSFQSSECPPLSVEFKDLYYRVLVPSQDDAPKRGICGAKKKMVSKDILKGITGVFQPGSLTAIMGASGAGKTTMLNAIAGESAGGFIEGDILVNGSEVGVDTMRRISAFVFQDDQLMASMTVREAIQMSADLRLPKKMTKEEKEDRVNHVIEILHLEKCSNTRIGSPTAKGGISGGERKRCAIGMELITNPSILFLDEPTTGLDTFMAFSVVDTLRQLAAAGRTVVATIHQPSSDTFHCFDNLLVLANGEIMYQGKAAEMVDYFGELGLKCPPYVNPADHLFMNVLNDVEMEEDGDKAGLQARTKRLLEHYNGSAKVQSMLKSTTKAVEFNVNDLEQRPGILGQMGILYTRSMKNVVRNPMIARAKFAQAMVLGSIVALIYHDLGHYQIDIQARTGALFFFAMNMVMNAFSMLSAFAQEKIVFEREQALGMYSVVSYFVPKVFSELPHNIIFPTIQACIVYWSLKLKNDAKTFGLFLVVHLLNTNAGNGLGIFIASIFSDLRITLIAAPPLILPLMIFSGFFINTNSIPPYFNWIKYISPMKYAFEAYALLEFR